LVAKKDCENKLETELQALFDQVNREKGTLLYTLHKAQDASNVFFFYEQYEDADALEAHMQSTVLQQVLARAASLLDGDPLVEVYDPLRTADMSGKPADLAFINAGTADEPLWVRRDIEGLQKSYCMCWKCKHFKPEQDDKGCSVIQRVLQVAAEEAVVLPVWACKSFCSL
jgi:quinol monooxygenase YgiN